MVHSTWHGTSTRNEIYSADHTIKISPFMYTTLTYKKKKKKRGRHIFSAMILQLDKVMKTLFFSCPFISLPGKQPLFVYASLTWIKIGLIF